MRPRCDQLIRRRRRGGSRARAVRRVVSQRGRQQHVWRRYRCHGEHRIHASALGASSPYLSRLADAPLALPMPLTPLVGLRFRGLATVLIAQSSAATATSASNGSRTTVPLLASVTSMTIRPLPPPLPMTPIVRSGGLSFPCLWGLTPFQRGWACLLLLFTSDSFTLSCCSRYLAHTPKLLTTLVSHSLAAALTSPSHSPHPARPTPSLPFPGASIRRRPARAASPSAAYA